MSGTVLRLRGKGIKVLNRESYGDLLITVKSEPPKAFTRKSKELIRDLHEEFDASDFPKYKEFLTKMKGLK